MSPQTIRATSQEFIHFFSIKRSENRLNFCITTSLLFPSTTMVQATVHAGKTLSGSAFNACLIFIHSYLELLQGALTILLLGRTHVISQPIKEKKDFKELILPIPRPFDDLSHHLSRDARERVPNAIKNVWRMAQARGPGKIITLANGMSYRPLI